MRRFTPSRPLKDASPRPALPGRDGAGRRGRLRRHPELAPGRRTVEPARPVAVPAFEVCDGFAFNGADAGAAFQCVVDHVNDGDTLRCRDGVRVRLHAVAAREADGTCSPGHPCPAASGASATAALNRLAAGKILTCDPVGRNYKRITAICSTPEGEEINCAMIRSGTTLIWEKFDRQHPICQG